MSRSRKTILALVAFLLVGSAAFAYKPMIHKIIIDSSGSVSTQDFRKMNAAAAVFLEILYRRSQLHPGEAAEWVSVSWFGGPKNYSSTIFVNCSNKAQMEQLQIMLLSKTHPTYGDTAIYSSILYGTIETMEHDKQLPYDYFKDIILLTDGQDGSPADHKKLLASIYPNNQVFLFVVGIGSGASVGQFEPYATNVMHLDNFDALMAFFVMLGEALE